MRLIIESSQLGDSEWRSSRKNPLFFFVSLSAQKPVSSLGSRSLLVSAT